ncbi:unnamed protein product [Trichogramma brassicae]|uniref:Uncharacterized protein n=1 Tax=Trichogramma brassicae TaxID=86971 RepID=A0A6H5IBL8_9HYME|nr:unnamed protein product [Trichogramma brassicae]
MGACPLGNGAPTPDFNYGLDPESVHLFFKNTKLTPITIFPGCTRRKHKIHMSRARASLSNRLLQKYDEALCAPNGIHRCAARELKEKKHERQMRETPKVPEQIKLWQGMARGCHKTVALCLWLYLFARVTAGPPARTPRVYTRAMRDRAQFARIKLNNNYRASKDPSPRAAAYMIMITSVVSRACHANSPARVSSKIIPRSIFYLFLRRIIFLARVLQPMHVAAISSGLPVIYFRERSCASHAAAGQTLFLRWSDGNKYLEQDFTLAHECLQQLSRKFDRRSSKRSSLPSHDTICTYIGASWAHERIYASPNDAHTHIHTPIICMKYKRRVQRIIRFLNKFRMHTYRNITRIPKSASKIIASPLSSSSNSSSGGSNSYHKFDIFPKCRVTMRPNTRDYFIVAEELEELGFACKRDREWTKEEALAIADVLEGRGNELNFCTFSCSYLRKSTTIFAFSAATRRRAPIFRRGARLGSLFYFQLLMMKHTTSFTNSYCSHEKLLAFPMSGASSQAVDTRSAPS